MNAQQIACPSCGSPVQFRSERTLYAACPNCRALLVRKDDSKIEPMGEVGEIQPDGTLLKVGTQGTYEGKAFHIIGRIQVVLGDVKAPTGYWNEWCASFASGQLGWIGEAQGEYFVNFEQKAEGIGGFGRFKVGESMTIGPTMFVVAGKTTGHVVTFEGELPFINAEHVLGRNHTQYAVPFADLRSATNVSATLDYSDGEPTLYLGKWCTFDELKFSGLRTGDEEQAYSASSSLVTSFKCKGCGAAHELKAGALSKSLICEYCGNETDLSDPTYSKIHKANEKKLSSPATIPLGKKLKFESAPKVEWENIGYLQKAVVIDGVQYTWSEYLLYEQRSGFRWLIESQGHWTFMEPIFDLPQDAAGHPVGDPLGAPLVYKGMAFKHFQTSRARVAYAAGEFYWKIRVGETSVSTDYVSPPYLLTVEVTEDEINWTRGTYLEPEAVYKAAGLTAQPVVPTSVFANQPNPYAARSSSYWSTFLVFVLLGVVMMGVVGAASSKPVWKKDLVYNLYEPERSQIFDLPLEGRTSNLRFKVTTGFENRWAFFQLTLINEATHTALDCGTTVSHYRDADGTYGSHSGEALLPMIAPGNYTLRVEPQTGTAETPEPNGPEPPRGSPSPQVFSYSIEAHRDVPLWGVLWWFCGFLLVPPLWVSYRSSQFETKRWAESDHAAQDEGDDDDD